MNKDVDIINKYRKEISRINQLLNQLKSDQIYEIKHRRGVPMCSTLAERLQNEIYDLLIKIQDNKDSMSVEIYKALNSF